MPDPALRNGRLTSTPAGESFEANIARRASPGKVRSWRNCPVTPKADAGPLAAALSARSCSPPLATARTCLASIPSGKW